MVVNMISTALYSSKTDDWSTPQDLFDTLDAEFDFTLDPCASDANHKCAKYYTAAENGLKQSWAGERVFCNPPYGRAIKSWVRKCCEESTKLCVMLIPARTDTAWFHDYIYHKADIRFIRGRLRFGNSRNSAPFPSMIVIFRGKNHDNN